MGVGITLLGVTGCGDNIAPEKSLEQIRQELIYKSAVERIKQQYPYGVHDYHNKVQNEMIKVEAEKLY